jgi:hypothetical protein
LAIIRVIAEPNDPAPITATLSGKMLSVADEKNALLVGEVIVRAFLVTVLVDTLLAILLPVLKMLRSIVVQ